MAKICEHCDKPIRWYQHEAHFKTYSYAKGFRDQLVHEKCYHCLAYAKQLTWFWYLDYLLGYLDSDHCSTLQSSQVLQQKNPDLYFHEMIRAQNYLQAIYKKQFPQKSIEDFEKELKRYGMDELFLLLGGVHIIPMSKDYTAGDVF